MQCTVSTNELIDEVLDFLSRYANYVVVGHKEPDGDCVGSQLALSRFLQHAGRTVDTVSAGPFLRTEIKCYERYFSKSFPKLGQGTAIVVVDCSNLERTGFGAESFPEDIPVLFIDHHASGSPQGQICYVDALSPASAFLVQFILEKAGYKLDPEIASLLFFGVITDTGFFRHLEKGAGIYFSAVARLVDAGASPKESYYAMNGGKQLAGRKLLGELLVRTSAHFDNKLLVSWLTLDDQERYGLESRDSDMLYQLLLTIENSEAVVIFRQESAEFCTIGFRSKKWVDVGALAAKFGGGGHKHASGAYVQGTVDSLKPQVLHAFEEVFGG